MRKLSVVIIILLMLSLTGCIKEFNVSEEKSDEAAEYMAGLLLKYDKDYEAGLTPQDQLIPETETAPVEGGNSAVTPTPAAVEGSADSETGKVTQTPAKNYTLTEVIGDKNFDIRYTGYQICETYPKDSTNAYFSLTPRDGNQLLVVSFTAQNIKAGKKSLNLINSEVKYQLDINVGTIYKPLFTLLENDLQYTDVTIGAGDTEALLLIFEVSKDVDIANINLMVSKGDKSEIIEVK